jgi:nucleotide-binding universal stress UspA family protein
MSGFRNILVATDFSYSARLALEEALRLPVVPGGTITLFHVHEVPPTYPHADATWATIVRDAELAAHEELTKLQLQAERSAEREGRLATLPKLKTKMVVGGPCAEILEEARRGQYDLIVVGTAGKKGLQRMIIGSVAERVVRMASCPVLTVRPVVVDAKAAHTLASYAD